MKKDTEKARLIKAVVIQNELRFPIEARLLHSHQLSLAYSTGDNLKRGKERQFCHLREMSPRCSVFQHGRDKRQYLSHGH